MNDRNTIHYAADSWSNADCARLAYLVKLGPPSSVQAACEVLKREGMNRPARGPGERPATTQAQWILANALALWKDIGRAIGLEQQ